MLENNRNIIYTYNKNGKSFNSFHVTVYEIGEDKYCVTYIQSNKDVTSYDFTTPEEIEKFNNAIAKDNENDIVYFTENMIDLVSDFLEINPDTITKIETKHDIFKHLNKYNNYGTKQT